MGNKYDYDKTIDLGWETFLEDMKVFPYLEDTTDEHKLNVENLVKSFEEFDVWYNKVIKLKLESGHSDTSLIGLK